MKVWGQSDWNAACGILSVKMDYPRTGNGPSSRQDIKLQNLNYQNIPLIAFLRQDLISAHIITPSAKDFAIFSIFKKNDYFNLYENTQEMNKA